MHQEASVMEQSAVRLARSRPRPDCYLCGAVGTVVYQGVSDRIWNVAGEWDIRRCSKDSCGLVWLDPCPVDEDVPLLYETYFTHESAPDGTQTRIELFKRRILAQINASKRPLTRRDPLGWFLSKIGVFRDYAEGSILWLSQNWMPGSLLDIGAGGGELLDRTRELGWSCAGLEPDEKARQNVKNRLGIEMRAATQDYSDDSFDVATMSHVIEHLTDPVSMLRDVRRILKPGGRLVIATPNVASLGHDYFGEKWLPLDPPRHLILFSPQNLKDCVERAGFEVETLWTSARSAFFVWYGSQSLKAGRKNQGLGRYSDSKVWIQISGLFFHLFEHYLSGIRRREEIVLVARKI